MDCVHGLTVQTVGWGLPKAPQIMGNWGMKKSTHDGPRKQKWDKQK